MFETPIHIVGTVITDPILRRVGDQSVYKFRVASNSRRRTADGNWEPGNSLYVSVNCWGNRLVKGVGASLVKGDPVIVVGFVHTSEYDDRDGVRRSSLEVRATAVGPDLARSIATIDRPKFANSADEDAAETKDDDANDDAEDDEAEDDAEAIDSGETVGAKVLPVSA